MNRNMQRTDRRGNEHKHEIESHQAMGQKESKSYSRQMVGDLRPTRPEWQASKLLWIGWWAIVRCPAVIGEGASARLVPRVSNHRRQHDATRATHKDNMLRQRTSGGTNGWVERRKLLFCMDDITRSMSTIYSIVRRNCI